MIWGFRARALFCGFNPMKANRRYSNALAKKFGACVCLLAVVLLWTPGWIAAFQASQMACCTAGMCPLHGLAPKRSSGEESGRMHTQATECGHHQRQAAMDCKAACYHPSDRTVASAVMFVLPGPVQLTVPLFSGKADLSALLRVQSLICVPPSPPPRS